MIAASFLLSTAAFAAGQNYLLIEKEGYISVFEEHDLINPFIMTKIAVRLLPDSDRNQLKEGIRVEGEDALLCILEDLGS